MSDMSKIEYITTEWIEQLKWEEHDLRKKAANLVLKAETLAETRFGFEKRMREYEKWSAKTEDKP